MKGWSMERLLNLYAGEKPDALVVLPEGSPGNALSHLYS